MGAFGGMEWVLIILVLLFLFGGKKIPQLARGLGRGIVEFRKAKDTDDDDDDSIESGKERDSKPDEQF
ncbi:MAG: twin-arginine translocase TatA/TatE family subunit [Balneolaceae bacterium]